MSKTQPRRAAEDLALEDLAQHPLEYSERKLLREGDVLSALKSVKRRQRRLVALLALVPLWMAAEVLIDLIDSGAAVTGMEFDELLHAWPQVIYSLLFVVVARQAWVSDRRFGAAIMQLEAGSEAP